jgi:hypothetical protein
VSVALVIVFAIIVAGGLQATFKALRIARQRGGGTRFADLPPSGQVFLVVCIAVGLAGGILLAASH